MLVILLSVVNQNIFSFLKWFQFGLNFDMIHWNALSVLSFCDFNCLERTNTAQFCQINKKTYHLKYDCYMITGFISCFMHKSCWINFDLCLSKRKKLFAIGIRKIPFWYKTIQHFGNIIICGLSTFFFLHNGLTCVSILLWFNEMSTGLCCCDSLSERLCHSMLCKFSPNVI